MYNYIFGTGYFADKMAEIFNNFGIKIDGLLELKDFYTPIPNQLNKMLPTYFVDQSFEGEESRCNIFVTQKAIIMGETIEYLRKRNFRNVYVISEELLLEKIYSLSDIYRFIHKIDFSKPFLNYLEVNVVDSCNLNCKGCAHFSNNYSGGYINMSHSKKI